MNKKLNLREAILAGDGPTTLKEAALLMAKGLMMGCADIVPGVSGGTIALITGIYSKLLKAVSSVADGLKNIAKLQFIEAATVIHFRFLISLAIGICIAIIGLAGLMHFLLETHPVPTWGMFFGLIIASILIIGKQAKAWSGTSLPLFLVGTVASFYIVGMIPVSTPETVWFIFFSGMIAICAMILPGISGAFLLLILGKYQFVTGALKNPFVVENIVTIVVFCCGCAVGLLGFSKFLSIMMDKHRDGTMALLTGFMLGSMRKIWPWKEITDSIIIRDKSHVLSTRNILPPQLDGEFLLTLILAVTGFILVLMLQKIADK